MKLFSIALFLLVLSVGEGAAWASTSTGNITVTATVTSSCILTVSPNISFTYQPTSSTPTTSSTTLATLCTAGTTPVVTLGQGSNPNTGSTDAAPLRRMQMGASGKYLTYSLYQDSGYTTTWGNTTATGMQMTSTGIVQNITVYAQAPASQAVPAGTYNDNVVVTFTY